MKSALKSTQLGWLRAGNMEHWLSWLLQLSAVCANWKKRIYIHFITFSFFFNSLLIILLAIYRVLRKNILEKLPPELFLNTRNITKLYVWWFHYVSSRCSKRYPSYEELFPHSGYPNWGKSRNINEAGEWWGERLTTPCFVHVLLSLVNTFYVSCIIRQMIIWTAP